MSFKHIISKNNYLFSNNLFNNSKMILNKKFTSSLSNNQQRNDETILYLKNEINNLKEKVDDHIKIQAEDSKIDGLIFLGFGLSVFALLIEINKKC